MATMAEIEAAAFGIGAARGYKMAPDGILRHPDELWQYFHRGALMTEARMALESAERVRNKPREGTALFGVFEPGLDALSDRESHRAAVDAGYAPLSEYVQIYGSRG